ncbi:unnamed protein product [Rotaria sp. Silwood2]|nr:unnamed protein product [Rotaria sp. Silwood2]CAF3187016.1 unnamed protein product [Rotaria sp. Silwood2]CAF4549839.1 unnamed protein product [Rotaria sp. Silwood2]CAF4560110.1 unnamed protein product [Rotaria sp. Silwood2]
MTFRNPIGNYQKGSPSTNQSPVIQHQNYTSKILTIIEDQNQERIPTLILKLKKETPSGDNRIKNFFQRRRSKSASSGDEIEQQVDATLESFKREIIKNIKECQQIVLSARPNPAM